MLLVDGRAGSKDLIKPLKKLLGDAMVEETTLTFGDVAFNGRGVNDTILDIGIEVKTLGDIIQCMRDGRFAGHQLPGMLKTYDYNWLLIETDGGYRADSGGRVAIYQGIRRGCRAVPGRMLASEFEKHLLTFELCGGVRVHHTNSRADSVRWLTNLYRWWSDTTLDNHTSHLAVHQPSMLGHVSDFRKAVMAWPSIGQKVSKSVEERFHGSIREACGAPVNEWAAIQTGNKRLGETTARRIDRFLDGGEKGGD